jgi:zinc D-Ala-D-Ala dipeptidase
VTLGALLALAAGLASAEPTKGLVDAAALIPGLSLDIRYATPDNFTKAALYPAAVCWLSPKAAKALAKVARDLRSDGLRLKAFDCYRPLSIQRKLWALVPDERYVADPAKGSRHNRGMAVDLTLTDDQGRALPMPTDYDDFSEKAHRGAPAMPEAARNRARLEKAMARRGFVGLPTEWWHFDLKGWERAPLLDAPLEEPR